jgi:hypothetical protein
VYWDLGKENTVHAIPLAYRRPTWDQALNDPSNPWTQGPRMGNVLADSVLFTAGGVAGMFTGGWAFAAMRGAGYSLLSAGATAGVVGDLTVQAGDNAAWLASDGQLGRSGISGTELAISAGLGALPGLPGAVRGWADDLRGLGVPDWNIRLASPYQLNSIGPGLFELERIGKLPLGFSQPSEFAAFGDTLYAGLDGAGFANAQAGFQGSSVTGRAFKAPHAPFDVGRVSDFDIALSSPELFEQARAAGVGLRQQGSRTGPLMPEHLERLGLSSLSTQLSKQAGREVNFMIYRSMDDAMGRSPTILVPRKPQ